MSEDLDEIEEFKEMMSDDEKIRSLEERVKILEGLNKELNEELRRKYSIFFPRSDRGLLADYPELKKNRRFIDVSRSELLFTWYFACEGSPLADIVDTKERIKESMDIAFGKKTEVKFQEKYLSENFPEKVKLAITDMKAFKTGPRVVARRMMDRILNNWMQITDIDASDNSNFVGKDGVDWTKKKAFVETGASISKNIGSVILQVEGSYSVSIKAEKEEESDFEDLIGDYHQSKQ